MNEFLMFLMENYVWILVVIVIIIITTIGFLADKKKTPKKIKIDEEKASPSIDVPTFVHDSATEKKVENQFVWNNMPPKKEELESSNKDHLENTKADNDMKLSEGNENQIVNPQMNMLNNGMPQQNINPMNNYNNQNMNNQNNMNNYSNGINLSSHGEMVLPTPVKNIENANNTIQNNNVELQNPNQIVNPQMNMLNNGMPQQNINPMNNYNNQNMNNQNNMNNYSNGINLSSHGEMVLPTPVKNIENTNNTIQNNNNMGLQNPNQINQQMNMLNNGMPQQNINTMNNYNSQNMTPIMNNQGTIPQSVSNIQTSNMTIPKPINMSGQNQQPTTNEQIPVNNTPVHEPIKVTPIPGMTGTAVSFVNGPRNNEENNKTP